MATTFGRKARKKLKEVMTLGWGPLFGGTQGIFVVHYIL